MSESLVTRASAGMEASPAELQAAWEVVLGDKQLPVIEDPALISRAIMERIRAAQSFEEAFAAQDLTAWRELEDVPVRVLSFHLNPSSVDEGGVFAVVDIERLDGEDGDKEGEPFMSVTCGAKNVLAQLLTILEHGWWDKPVKMTSDQTAAGYTVLRLEAA